MSGVQTAFYQSTFAGEFFRASGASSQAQSGAPPPGTPVSPVPAQQTGAGPTGVIGDIQAAGFTTSIAGQEVQILYPFS